MTSNNFGNVRSAFVAHVGKTYTGDPANHPDFAAFEAGYAAICAESASQLARVYSEFGIGEKGRTMPTLIANIQNCKRFASYLRAIENEFFMVPGEPDEDYPDEEPEPECLLNSWGSTEQQRDAVVAAIEIKRTITILEPASHD